MSHRWSFVPFLCLVAVLTSCNGCSDEELVEDDEGFEELPEIEAPVVETTPGFPRFDDRNLLTAPANYEHVILRLRPPVGARFRNLFYETDNVTMRGGRAESGLYRTDGPALSKKWREAAAGVKGMFILRDALFSQQDHPIDHPTQSVMMPASWVTVAVNAAMEGEDIKPVLAPNMNDDVAWRRIANPRALFGSFPYSERLFETATKPRTAVLPDRAFVTNARHTIQSLARDVNEMLKAVPKGPKAIAVAGARRITRSDKRYFGIRLRKEHVILMNVENPTPHEWRDERKGLRPFRGKVSEEAVTMVRKVLYGARLKDGPLALLRYNINSPDDRKRLIKVLTELIPKHSIGHDLWVFVDGGLDPKGNSGEDGTNHMWRIRGELKDADVEHSRLRFLSKPSERLPEPLARSLWAQARRYERLELPMSVNIPTSVFSRLLAEVPDAPKTPR